MLMIQDLRQTILTRLEAEEVVTIAAPEEEYLLIAEQLPARG